ncbi:hypothetical protein HYQ46_006253 [Verticillium longisporum]|nr:hypothetical protein HYQ46_006253 [Verticillium longisporum]
MIRDTQEPVKGRDEQDEKCLFADFVLGLAPLCPDMGVGSVPRSMASGQPDSYLLAADCAAAAAATAAAWSLSGGGVL